MAIYLDEQTRPYLERLIEKQIEKSDKDFIAKRIEGMLSGDRERINEISNCHHKYGEYIGRSISCQFCDHLLHESWFFKKTVRPKKTKLPFIPEQLTIMKSTNDKSIP